MEIFPNWTVFPIVFFLIVLTFILNRTFFRPLGKVLEERSQKIQGAQKEAEEIRRVSQDRLAEFDKRMREARRVGDQQMASVKNQALSERGALLSARRAEAEKMLSEARGEIRQKKDAARKELESQTQSFAYQIAARILKRPVSPKKSIQA